MTVMSPDVKLKLGLVCAISSALLTGCSVHTMDSVYRDMYPGAYPSKVDAAWLWIKERATPRPWKHGVFGTPSAYNQQEENTGYEKAMRELRNGTREAQTIARRQDLYEKEGGAAAYSRKVSNYYKNAAFQNGDYHELPEDSSAYGQGFEDGCKTSVSIMGLSIWRLLGSKMDAKRLIDTSPRQIWYQRGYNDGSAFCAYRTDFNIR